jgi:hypothetical protein
LRALTWTTGDSVAERFETAKAYVIACRPKRRRPGRTVQGFETARDRLPLAVLRALAAGLRTTLLRLVPPHAEGFRVVGCDGSALT